MKIIPHFVPMLLFILGMSLTGCTSTESQDWQESPTFEIPYTASDGKKSKYVLRGEEGRLGFLIDSYSEEDGKPAEFMPIVAGQGNKYMWHFWGSAEEVAGKLKIIGINEKGEKHQILIASDGKTWEYPEFGVNPHNGADTHVPSLMEFPTAGLWMLETYIDDRLFGSVVVNVQDDH